MTNTRSKQQQLDALADEIISSGVCESLATQATQLVFGDGNPDAELVFIGEAPGKNEDKQGKPFVGAAGRLLNDMLQSIGLDREDIYITNIVKYRPPENRDPTPAEKAAFLPYLQTQLDIIQPKAVATLGRHSMNCFLPDLQISKVHGQPLKVALSYLGQAGGDGVDVMQGTAEQRTEPYQVYGEGAEKAATQQRITSSGRDASPTRKQTDATVVILPLYHPAAALYNGSLRQTLFSDFSKIPSILNQSEINS